MQVKPALSNFVCRLTYNFDHGSRDIRQQIYLIMEAILSSIQAPSKFFIILSGVMVKNGLSSVANFRHKTKLVLSQEAKRSMVEEALNDIQTHLETFLKNCSGWTLDQFDKVWIYYFIIIFFNLIFI